MRLKRAIVLLEDISGSYSLYVMKAKHEADISTPFFGSLFAHDKTFMNPM